MKASVRQDDGSTLPTASPVTAPGATGELALPEPVHGGLGEPTLLDGHLAGAMGDLRRDPTIDMDSAGVDLPDALPVPEPPAPGPPGP